MITSFQFTQTPQIVFGCGKRSELPQWILKYGKNVLVVTGNTSFVNSNVWVVLQEQLHTNDISWNQVSIKNEPSPAEIDIIADQYRADNIQCVVAIGGGSVLDAGKAISAMLLKNDSVKDYLEGVGIKNHDGQKVPFIAVPTTSGTGSEATKNAVLSEVGENGFKKSLRHDLFVPNVALIDPELTLNCPRILTANSGMDAFTQLLESYLSTKSNTLTDTLAIKGLECIRNYLQLSIEDGQNIEARTEMAYASFTSGITLANAGLGTVHGLAGTIGGYFPMPHGAICGTLMEPVNKVTVRKLRAKNKDYTALYKYAMVGRLFSQQGHKSDAYYIDYLLHLIEDWTLKFDLPKLSQYGMEIKDFERIVKNSDNKNNPIALTGEEMKEVLSSRW